MSKSDDGALAVFGCFGLIAAFPIMAMLNGYALAVLWGWFVVPVFRLTALSVVQAIGIAMVVSYLTQSSSSAIDKSDSWWEPFAKMAMKPLFALAFGWVVKQFM